MISCIKNEMQNDAHTLILSYETDLETYFYNIFLLGIKHK